MINTQSQAVPGRKGIFIDKDGTLIKDVPYNADPGRVQLAPGCEYLSRLQEAGYIIVVISNQSGISKGYFTEEQLLSAVDRMFELLAEKEVFPYAFYFCPHSDIDLCTCRKPQPGLLYLAANDLQIDLSDSWMIGDILNDIEAGKRAGCRTILINNGNETEWLYSPLREPDLIRPDLGTASETILQNMNAHEPHL